jgi:Na+/H+-dicarboxylate symporter
MRVRAGTVGLTVVGVVVGLVVGLVVGPCVGSCTSTCDRDLNKKSDTNKNTIFLGVGLRMVEWNKTWII